MNPQQIALFATPVANGELPPQPDPPTLGKRKLVVAINRSGKRSRTADIWKSFDLYESLELPLRISLMR